jgi:hypothetical protein
MPSKGQPQSDLLAYHRPKLRLSQAPYRLKRESVLYVPIPPVTLCIPNHTLGLNYRCLKNLSNYKAPPSSVVYPRARCAAVLVALFGGRMGDLYVLLSRLVSLNILQGGSCLMVFQLKESYDITNIRWRYVTPRWEVRARRSDARGYRPARSLRGGKFYILLLSMM